MLARSVAGMLLALVVLSAPARADAPFTIGSGGSPDIAVDPSGGAHIVYRQPNGADRYDVKYCRLPAGAKACQVSLTLGGPVDLDDPMVVLGGGAVYVVVPHYVSNTLDVFVSTDNGASFSGPVSFTDADPNNNRLAGTQSEDALFGPGQSLSITTWNPGQYYLNLPLPLTGGPVTAANFASLFAYNFSAGLSGETPILAAWAIMNNAPTQTATWSPANPGPLDDGANWSGPNVLGQGEDTALAGGPRGLYLMNFATRDQPYANVVQVRRFTGAGFGAPVSAATGESSNCGSCNDLFEDSSGGLYAVWRGAN